MEFKFNEEEMKKEIVKQAVRQLLESSVDMDADDYEDWDEAIAPTVVRIIDRRVGEKFEEYVINRFESEVDAPIHSAIKKAMSARLDRTDVWGSQRGTTPTTWNERIEKKVQEMLLERVDRDGRKDNGYGDKHTRLEWFLEGFTAASDEVRRKINNKKLIPNNPEALRKALAKHEALREEVKVHIHKRAAEQKAEVEAGCEVSTGQTEEELLMVDITNDVYRTTLAIQDGHLSKAPQGHLIRTLQMSASLLEAVRTEHPETTSE